MPPLVRVLGLGPAGEAGTMSPSALAAGGSAASGPLRIAASGSTPRPCWQSHFSGIKVPAELQQARGQGTWESRVRSAPRARQCGDSGALPLDSTQRGCSRHDAHECPSLATSEACALEGGATQTPRDPCPGPAWGDRPLCSACLRTGKRSLMEVANAQGSLERGSKGPPLMLPLKSRR